MVARCPIPQTPAPPRCLRVNLTFLLAARVKHAFNILFAANVLPGGTPLNISSQVHRCIILLSPSVPLVCVWATAVDRWNIWLRVAGKARFTFACVAMALGMKGRVVRRRASLRALAGAGILAGAIAPPAFAFTFNTARSIFPKDVAEDGWEGVLGQDGVKRCQAAKLSLAGVEPRSRLGINAPRSRGYGTISSDGTARAPPLRWAARTTRHTRRITRGGAVGRTRVSVSSGSGLRCFSACSLIRPHRWLPAAAGRLRILELCVQQRFMPLFSTYCRLSLFNTSRSFFLPLLALTATLWTFSTLFSAHASCLAARRFAAWFSYTSLNVSLWHPPDLKRAAFFMLARTRRSRTTGAAAGAGGRFSRSRSMAPGCRAPGVGGVRSRRTHRS